ncbi:MAG: primosomal protein N' [Clostridia bacterium]|nr:primosomal protein N' [Clostridia bacterium]
MKMFARVYLLDAPYFIDRGYDYFIPPAIRPYVDVGSIVTVPFGMSNRRGFALVVEMLDDATDEHRIKPIISYIDRRYALTQELLEIVLFLKERAICTAGGACHAVLPPALFVQATEIFTLTEQGERKLALEPVLAAVKENGGRMTLDALVKRLGRIAIDQSHRLYTTGDLYREHQPIVPKNIKTMKIYRRLDVPMPGVMKPLNPDDRRVLGAFDVEPRLTHEELRACEPLATPRRIDKLVKGGYLGVETVEVTRNPYAELARRRVCEPITLSRTQSAAYDTLLSLYREDAPRAALLYGVTGSGKTNVMMQLIDRVLEDDKDIILMVPEIALTPQTVGKFCKRYGERVAVLHSGLSAGERFDAWRRIRENEVDLVIGTRSAVFAPLPNLGLVILDEEHEHTYKSESDPKYHAREVAAFRCGQKNALMLLASATPSIESFRMAKQGRYTLVELRERYGGIELPSTEIVDMRQELQAGNRSPISRSLLTALQTAIGEGKQAILFLNRRGYDSTLSCRACGTPVTCPHCSVGLTHHLPPRGVRGAGYLLCHVCGHRATPPRVCPHCGSDEISYAGYGTQKIEGELSTLLPEARVLRMDADTTGTKDAHDQILDAFRRHEADILLGTQMVTKGHDFPDVSVVGVVSADASLHMNDFRASERTFALITQVVGRAGRRGGGGHAVIQTFDAQNEVIRLAAAQDYDSFYERELALRRSLSFPPFCDIAVYTVSSATELLTLQNAETFRDNLLLRAKDQLGDLPWEIYGPFEAQTYKVGNRFRLRIVVKCNLTNRMRKFLWDAVLDAHLEKLPALSITLDLNPTVTL